MNLDDIPKIRKKLQAMYDDHEKARSEWISRKKSNDRVGGSHKETALERINGDYARASKNFDDALEELTYGLFGQEISGADISTVLDWIEHFLKEGEY